MRSHRPGLTLIEVVVALLVCSIGALAALSTQASMIRERSRSRALRDQVASATAILDSLATISCTNLASGGRITRVATLRWNVTPLTKSMEITMAVRPIVGSTTPWTVRSVVPCP
jgi:prepilin-type N-terminal cleavage/methylation domain-containing protein